MVLLKSTRLTFLTKVTLSYLFTNFIIIFLALLKCCTTVAAATSHKYSGIIIENGMPVITVKMEELQNHSEQIYSAVSETTSESDVPLKKSNKNILGYEIKQRKVWVPVTENYSEEIPNTILGRTATRVVHRSPDRYTFNCTAPYLTRWTTTIVPRLQATYGHCNRNDHNPLQPNSSMITFSSQIVFWMPHGKSGYIQCQNVKNATMATKVYIYSQAGEPFQRITKNALEPPLITDTRKSFIVPCKANYPDVVAKLVKVKNDPRGQELNMNHSDIIGGYDPQVGFLVKGNEVMMQYYRCKTNSTSRKSDRLTFIFYNPYLDPNYDQYSIRFLKGNKSLGISCMAGNHGLTRIAMLQCNSVYECDWFNDCYNDKCESNKISRFSSSPYREGEKMMNGNFPNPYPRGKVMCISADNKGVVAYDYLFTGLDRQKYWLYSQADEINQAKLILLSPAETPIFYTNTSVSFSCDTVNFFLLPNVKFVVMFNNGSNALLDDMITTGDLQLDTSSGIHRKKIVLNLTKDMVGIMCMAPWLNSSEWINASSMFEVKDFQAPLIGNKAPQVTFYVGDESRSLFCDATGEPKPTITWKVPSGVYQKFTNVNQETLPFPVIDFAFEGLYYCQASNDYGHNETVFNVRVEKLASSEQHIETVIAVFSGLLIGIFVLTVVCIRKAREKKVLLTPEEIDEFIKGRLKEKGESSDNSDNIQASIIVTSDGDLPLTHLEKEDTSGCDTECKSICKNWNDKDNHNLVDDPVYVGLSNLTIITEQAQPKQQTNITEDDIQAMKFDRNYEIQLSNLKIEQKIGEGSFGEVKRGVFREESVAIKTTLNSNKQCIKALLAEIKVMQYISKWSHPNIVKYLGAVISEIEIGKVLVVVELCPLGCLKNFLNTLECSFINLLSEEETVTLCGKSYEEIKMGVSILNLVSWCEQIASGMHFLTSKNIIHGDLATRNVLRFDNDVVKITDFGMAKNLYSSPLYQKKMKSNEVEFFPVHWMAIESLQFLQFSPQSDVWSFAVTAWEIFTLGQAPILGFSFQEIINQLKSRRLEKPAFATSMIYLKLRECWRLKPEDRPTFSGLQSFFCNMLQSMRFILEHEVSPQTVKLKEIVPVSAADNVNLSYVTIMHGYNEF